MLRNLTIFKPNYEINQSQAYPYYDKIEHLEMKTWYL